VGEIKNSYSKIKAEDELGFIKQQKDRIAQKKRLIKGGRRGLMPELQLHSDKRKTFMG